MNVIKLIVTHFSLFPVTSSITAENASLSNFKKTDRLLVLFEIGASKLVWFDFRAWLWHRQLTTARGTSDQQTSSVSC
jgi:hypothetical protein